MTPGDILWFFFFFSALQPVLKQRFLEASRLRLLGKIERKRKIVVISRRIRDQSLTDFAGSQIRFRFVAKFFSGFQIFSDFC